MIEVTFRDFSELAQRREWTAAFLAERFRGKIEEPKEFFERVLSCRQRGADRGGVVIPYKSVLEFYRRELSPLMADRGFRACACGCGKPVYGRKRLASGACRKRQERRRSRTGENGGKAAGEQTEPRRPGAFP